MIDLRSDTVTRPSDAMRRAMANAPVGDDQYGEDPTVRALQERMASLLGKEAAIFLPSGTMAQQSVLRVHADRRQRRAVVYHPLCHLDRHEDRAFQRLHGLIGRPADQARPGC